MKDNVIIIFTRIPVPGKTKTRLQPFITGEECCLLQRAFIRDIYEVLQEPDLHCDIVVSYAPEGDIEDLKALLPGVETYFPQHGQSLGDKMYDATRQMLEKGYSRCLLIGSDHPLIKVSAIKEAFALLDQCDIVLCPTEDGGYYLIGMKEPCEEVFRLEAYSDSAVFDKTLAAATESGKACMRGTCTLDVDEPEDLFRLAESLAKENPNVCRETRKALSVVISDF